MIPRVRQATAADDDLMPPKDRDVLPRAVALPSRRRRGCWIVTLDVDEKILPRAVLCTVAEDLQLAYAVEREVLDMRGLRQLDLIQLSHRVRLGDGQRVFTGA